MVAENIEENVELFNTTPINTIMSNVQWSEGSSIIQPWEISQKFLWEDQEVIPEVSEEQDNENVQPQIQEVSLLEQEFQVNEMNNYIYQLGECLIGTQEYARKLGNDYLQEAKINENLIQMIKEQEATNKLICEMSDRKLQEQEEEINNLRQEVEKLKEDLKIEKLYNECIDYFAIPEVEENSMELENFLW